MRILGVNAFHADAAACALASGRLVLAVEEERFARVKHWAGLPRAAMRACLVDHGQPSDEGKTLAVAVSRQPRRYLLRKAVLALTHLHSLPRAASRVKNLACVGNLRRRLGEEYESRDFGQTFAVEHHVAHIASAYYCSPFDEAACLSVDGFGDFASAMFAVGRGHRVTILGRVLFPHSLGHFYTAVTQFLGFPKYGDEYKVMGLAAYGEPRFVRELRQVVRETKDGTYRLDLRYFRHLSEGVDMTWEDGEPRIGDLFTPELEALLGPRRRPDEELTERHKDIAASLQMVYEERFFALVRRVLRQTRLKKLCLAGGCALNSVANGKLFQATDVEDVFIQPAAADSGTALGAAQYAYHHILGHPRDFVMTHAFWGPGYDDERIRRAIVAKLGSLTAQDAPDGRIVVETARDEQALCAQTARAIAAGEVVGWYQGRSEWGPRALGNRSILADPRRSDMRDLLNLKIKHRERFRPFAPSVLQEETGKWFTESYPDPFMLKVYPIRPDRRPRIPAVTHVDGTGRLQTVDRETNPLYWRLIREFQRLTGVPMLLNTSFNENEPIVNTPEEALDCFLRTKMDRLVLHRMVIRRVSSADRRRPHHPPRDWLRRTPE